MFLCLHTHLLLCSAQHCPPAPSCLPTLVPPGQRFHDNLDMMTTMMPPPPLSPPLLLTLFSISHLFPMDDETPSIKLLFSPLSPLSPLISQTFGWHPFPNQDYFDIVKNPMDLSTIKRKLDTGQYQEPWQYVDDIWLMFNNAWLYNRKTSRVYKYCSKLAEVFESEIDPVMQGLGYCCGRKVRRVHKISNSFRFCPTRLTLTLFVFLL